MLLSICLGAMAGLSCALALWQWWVARRFPLHQRLEHPCQSTPCGQPACPEGAAPVPDATGPFAPAVTLLKPLKGADAQTEASLESWLCQEYAGPVQVLFGVASEADPVCEVVRRLLERHSQVDARLVVCREALGPNAKVSTLAQLQPAAEHDLLVVSDADVRVPSDFLAALVQPFRALETELVCPFYRLANPTTVAMRWEAIAVNADFWSSVLQARSFGPLRFALGAVMALKRGRMETVGGFAALVDYLADDYQLGNRVVREGGRIVLCPVVVDCYETEQGWGSVWRHQLRWARTIRVCQPGPYAGSIISNASLWPLLWVFAQPTALAAGGAGLCLVVRLLTAAANQRKLIESGSDWRWLWLTPVKDLLQAALWGLAFLGNRVEWRGERFSVERGGKLRRDA